MFKGLKIQCKIGKNKIEFKKGDDRPACITLKYDFDVDFDFVNTKKAELYNFFYTKNKKICISSESNINNTEYIKTHTAPPTYNKDLNKLLLTLIDIINIDLQMTHCVVTDAAFITCINEITISLDIKHYARGYGFYNEFGYIYINNDNKDTKVNTDTLEQNINYANIILNSIHDLSHKTISELDLKLKELKDIAENELTVDSIISSKINLLTLCDILKIINEPPKTVRQLLNEIFHLMCNSEDSEDSETIETINKLINTQKYYLDVFIGQMFVLQRLMYNNNPHTFEFHKCYDTTNKEGRIYTSELNIPSDENPVPSFEMKEFIQPKINIISGIDDVEYIIDIK